MKNDAEIQRDVIDQLKWNPLLNSSEIGVAVSHGVVTLSGQVDSYLKKVEAEKEAKRVFGVKALAEDIHVGVSPSFMRTDTEIAQAIISAFSWHISVPADQIQIKVEDGVVTLDGEVDWDYQREAAKNAVTTLASVRDVISKVRLKEKATTDNVKKRIGEAFHRIASIDGNRILLEVANRKAVLRGTVHSFLEKDEAEDATWAAPGILEVDNQLEVIDDGTQASF